MSDIGTKRTLADIADEIRRDWGSRENYAATPYIDAMLTLHNVHQSYGADTGRSVVVYFLANAGSWRGETARRVKAELKALVK